MDGYYDPHPRMTLEQPLVLVGHPGAGVTHIASSLAGRTGLPSTQVERWTEAAAGRSRGQVLLEDGVEGLAKFDAEALTRALARQPAGFISVGSGIVLEAARSTRLDELACVVFVRRPVPVLWQRVREQLKSAPASVVEFLAAAPPTPEEMDAWLRRREGVEQIAHAIVEAGDRHATRIADELYASLGQLTGAVTPVS